MTSKRIRCILVTALFLLNLTACGAAPSVPAPSPTTGSTTGTTIAETEKPTITTTTTTEPTTTVPVTDPPITGTTLAPGTPPDVSTIPTADESQKGETHTLHFHDGNTHMIVLLYMYDPTDGYERLVYMQDPTFEIPHTELRVYETALGGVQGLCRGLQTGIHATVRAEVNISTMEAMYFSNAASYSTGMVYDPAELVDITAPPTDFSQSRQIVLVQIKSGAEKEPWQPLDNGYYVIVKANAANENSEELKGDLAVVNRIVQRYELETLLRWSK